MRAKVIIHFYISSKVLLGKNDFRKSHSGMDLIKELEEIIVLQIDQELRPLLALVCKDWARIVGKSQGNQVSLWASENGYSELLKWSEKNCLYPTDIRSLLKKAIKGVQLDILEYLSTCKYFETRTLAYIIMFEDHVEVSEWFLQRFPLEADETIKDFWAYGGENLSSWAWELLKRSTYPLGYVDGKLFAYYAMGKTPTWHGGRPIEKLSNVTCDCGVPISQANPRTCYCVVCSMDNTIETCSSCGKRVCFHCCDGCFSEQIRCDGCNEHVKK